MVVKASSTVAILAQAILAQAVLPCGALRAASWLDLWCGCCLAWLSEGCLIVDRLPQGH